MASHDDGVGELISADNDIIEIGRMICLVVL